MDGFGGGKDVLRRSVIDSLGERPSKRVVWGRQAAEEEDGVI